MAEFVVLLSLAVQSLGVVLRLGCGGRRVAGDAAVAARSAADGVSGA